jgi:hypothetical protein
MFKKRKFPRQIFEIYSDFKFHENPTSGSGDVICGRTGGETDMVKLISADCNVAGARLKIEKSFL